MITSHKEAATVSQARDPRFEKPVMSILDPDVQLLCDPDKDDYRFNDGKAHTIFGNQNLDSGAVTKIESSSQLEVKTKKQHRMAILKADFLANQGQGRRKTARWFENYLSAYYDRPVELVRLIVSMDKDGKHNISYQFNFKDEFSKLDIDWFKKK